MKECITVVIPTYNRRDMLETAVTSVLQENRVPISLHVFDNASSDGTDAYLEALAKRDPRVTVTRNSSNIGCFKNYIKALDSIKSAYYVPLADDDFLVQDFLFDAYRLLKSYPDAYAAVFFAESRNKEGQLECSYPTRTDDPKQGLLLPHAHMEAFFTFGHYVWSSILWRTETLKHVGYPYFHTDLCSDVDFQIQVFAKYPVVLSPQIGAVYNAHGDQASTAYDVNSVACWSKMIARMDTAVSPLFKAGEYLALRSRLLDRYRGIWNIPAKTAIEPRKRLALAAIAGTRLNDWPLAVRLMADASQENFGQKKSMLASLVNDVLSERKKIVEFQEIADVKQAELRAEIERLQGMLVDLSKASSETESKRFNKLVFYLSSLNSWRKSRRRKQKAN